jgi:hypothetical protein
MSDSQIHEMQFERFHLSGAQEWFCSTCGRRLLMKWPPSFEKQVLVPGNANAFHTGGKIDHAPRPLSMSDRSEFDLDGFPRVDETHIDAPISLDMLRPWIKWARDAGIDDLWNQAT